MKINPERSSSRPRFQDKQPTRAERQSALVDRLEKLEDSGVDIKGSGWHRFSDNLEGVAERYLGGKAKPLRAKFKGDWIKIGHGEDLKTLEYVQGVSDVSPEIWESRVGEVEEVTTYNLSEPGVSPRMKAKENGACLGSVVVKKKTSWASLPGKLLHRFIPGEYPMSWEYASPHLVHPGTLEEGQAFSIGDRVKGAGYNRRSRHGRKALSSVGNIVATIKNGEGKARVDRAGSLTEARHYPTSTYRWENKGMYKSDMIKDVTVTKSEFVFAGHVLETDTQGPLRERVRAELLEKHGIDESNPIKHRQATIYQKDDKAVIEFADGRLAGISAGFGETKAGHLLPERLFYGVDVNYHTKPLEIEIYSKEGKLTRQEDSKILRAFYTPENATLRFGHDNYDLESHTDLKIELGGEDDNYNAEDWEGI